MGVPEPYSNPPICKTKNEKKNIQKVSGREIFIIDLIRQRLSKNFKCHYKNYLDIYFITYKAYVTKTYKF